MPQVEIGAEAHATARCTSWAAPLRHEERSQDAACQPAIACLAASACTSPAQMMKTAAGCAGGIDMM